MTHRKPRRFVTLIAASALAVGLVGVVPPTSANTEPIVLDGVADALAYLDSKGVDTSSALVQEGTSNYAGPTCPGIDWTCATPEPGQPVVQRTSAAGGQNVVELTGPLCFVVQMAEDGDNSVSCSTSGETTDDANAVVAQQNVAGSNGSYVGQAADQTVGNTQHLAQAADVHQQIVKEGAGSNLSTIEQYLYQTTEGFSPIVQTQTSSQIASIDQFGHASDNGSTLIQSLEQHANAVGTEATQHQNASGTEQYMQNRVNQQSVSGSNLSLVDSSTVQSATISPPVYEFSASAPDLTRRAAAGAATTTEPTPPPDPLGATQVQGCAECGILGQLTQHSEGVSTANAILSEHQDMSADVENPTQVQYGPVIVPPDRVPSPSGGVRCCADQSGNPDNLFTLEISSTQNATPGGEMHNYVLGTCTTSGNCNANVGVTQNGTQTTSACAGTDCGVAVQCAPGQTCNSADNAEPDTAIVDGPPASTTAKNASFSFTGTEPGSFICALDEADWEDCGTPKTYAGLGTGTHLFRVAAVDLAGNVDQTPASLTWVIESLIDTTIDSSPPDFTNQSTARFTFHASEPNATFECRFDAGSWDACASPKTIGGVTPGTHFMAVRAVDEFGTPDSTPDLRAWIVDQTGPLSRFTTPNGARRFALLPGNGTVDGVATDDVSGIDRVVVRFTLASLTWTRMATLSCNGPRTSCSWSVPVADIPPGAYTATEQAFDRAGNEDAASSITVIVV